MIQFALSDAFWTALAAGIPATVMAAATFVQAWRAHKAFNSKMDRFLKLTAESSRAEGVREGEANQVVKP